MMSQPARAQRDRGFTLMELLVAVIIIAVLVAVAVPVWLNQKKKGVDASIRADLRSIARAEDDYVLDSKRGYANGTTDPAVLRQHGASYSEKNLIQIALREDGFCLRGHNPNAAADGTASGGYIWYDSRDGGLKSERSYAPVSNGACTGLQDSEWRNITTAPTGGGSNTAAQPSDPNAPPITSGGTDSPAPPSSGGDEQMPPANDTCPETFNLAQPSENRGVVTSGDVTNVAATDDAYGQSSVFWKIHMPQSAHEVVWLEDPASGSLNGTRTLTIYRGLSGSDVQGCPGPLTIVDTTTGVAPGVAFRVQNGNDNYYAVVTSTVSNQSAFKIANARLDSDPRADHYTSPENIEAGVNQTSSQDYGFSTRFATNESNETPDGYSTTWHRVNNWYSEGTDLPSYEFSVLAPTNGQPAARTVIVDVFRDGTSADNPGTLVASASGGMGTTVSFSGPPSGGNYRIRVRSLTGREGGDYRVTLRRGAV